MIHLAMWVAAAMFLGTLALIVVCGTFAFLRWLWEVATEKPIDVSRVARRGRDRGVD